MEGSNAERALSKGLASGKIVFDKIVFAPNSLAQRAALWKFI